MSGEPDKNQPTLQTGRDASIGGDVAGRDKVTTTTTITESGPVARYAVVGLSVIAALALVAVTLIASPNLLPFIPLTGPTPTLTATVVAPSSTFTLTPSPSTTPTRTATRTATLTPSPTISPSPTAAPATLTPQPTASETLAPNITPLPASTLPLYDDFNDACLDANRWSLTVPEVATETPTPTAMPVLDGCLQSEAYGFTEGVNGKLSVFLSLEGDETRGLAEAPGGCYREAEVTLTLREVAIIDGRHADYLWVALSIQQVTRAARLEVRLRGGNEDGPLQYHVLPRLIVAGGYTDVPPALVYQPGQPVTLAFRVKDVGAFNLATGAASIGKVLTIFANDIALSPSYSIRGYPCNLTLGYHAEEQTLLDGHFDEVRFIPAP